MRLVLIYHITAPFVGLACCSAAYGQATFQGLGTLFPGGSAAAGISGNATSVVGSTADQNHAEPFRWRASTGMVSLGLLPGHTTGQGFGTNWNGDVVVGYSLNQAFRWSESSGMQGLGFLPGGSNSWAWSTSHDGAVVVGHGNSFNSTGGIGQEAFRWTHETGMVGLGDLPGGDFHSRAHGVSGDGSVVVGLAHNGANDDNKAFRWTSAAGMVELPDIPGGEYFSGARAVTGDGSITGGYSFSSLGQEAILWTESGYVTLGDLHGGIYSAGVLAVNVDASVVVGSSNSDRGYEPFYWTQSLGMVSLTDYLLKLGATGMEGWTLTGAFGLSADGLTICGTGINPLGFNEGWVAHLGSLPCYADCDSSGTLNIFDYICFSNAYWAQQPYADCDKNGTFSIFDYSCFADKYASGCP